MSFGAIFNLFKTKAIASNATVELLTQPLIIEAAESLKVQASDANELHVIASNNSSDNILFIVEVQIFVLVEASDILLGLLNCICVHGLADI